jgi:hypothetical protein
MEATNCPDQGEHLADQVPPPCRPACRCRPNCDISQSASIAWWMLATGRRRGAEYVSNANGRNPWAAFFSGSALLRFEIDHGVLDPAPRVIRCISGERARHAFDGSYRRC